MYQDYKWNQFMESIDSFKNSEIPEHFRRQFKSKDEFIYPRDKRFPPLAKRLQTDEKLRTQRKWDKDCKTFLLWTMIRFFQVRDKNQVDPSVEEWEELSQLLRMDKHALKARWITLINPKQKSSNWTEQEDDVIIESMRQRLHKHIWTQMAVKLYELNIGHCARTPKQVRERWINYLNPNLRKDQWLMKEDIIILGVVLKKGKKWSYISKKLEGRTENQVKNRYKSLINKIVGEESTNEPEAISLYIKKNQSAINSMKQGMVGKRGRHKQVSKGNQVMKQEKKLYLNSSVEDMDEEDVETYLSEISPVKQKKIKENNCATTKQKQYQKQEQEQHQHQHSEQKIGEYKDFQKDFSNYFNQIMSNQYEKFSPYHSNQQFQAHNNSCFQLGGSQPASSLLPYRDNNPLSPLFFPNPHMNRGNNQCSPIVKRMHYDHQFKKDNVSPHNEYSIAVQSALLLELSPFYIKDDKKLSNMKINEIREI